MSRPQVSNIAADSEVWEQGSSEVSHGSEAFGEIPPDRVLQRNDRSGDNLTQKSGSSRKGKQGQQNHLRRPTQDNVQQTVHKRQFVEENSTSQTFGLEHQTVRDLVASSVPDNTFNVGKYGPATSPSTQAPLLEMFYHSEGRQTLYSYHLRGPKLASRVTNSYPYCPTCKPLPVHPKVTLKCLLDYIIWNPPSAKDILPKYAEAYICQVERATYYLIQQETNAYKAHMAKVKNSQTQAAPEYRHRFAWVCYCTDMSRVEELQKKAHSLLHLCPPRPWGVNFRALAIRCRDNTDIDLSFLFSKRQTRTLWSCQDAYKVFLQSSILVPHTQNRFKMHHQFTPQPSAVSQQYNTRVAVSYNFLTYEAQKIQDIEARKLAQSSTAPQLWSAQVAAPQNYLTCEGQKIQNEEARKMALKDRFGRCLCQNIGLREKGSLLSTLDFDQSRMIQNS